MATVIAGGTAAHRRLLEEILAGLGSTGIKRVRIGSHVVRAVPGDLPTEEDARRASGLSLELVDPEEHDVRVEWELNLVGAALRERAMREGLEQVVWLSHSSGAGALQYGRRPDGPMSASEVEQVAIAVESAAVAAGATLEGFDLLRPLGHAWAARLRVDEPHAFLRLRFGGFMRAVRPWQDRCGRQVYIEVVDHCAEPVMTIATGGYGGRSRVRPDLGCCDPLVHVGTPTFARRRPRCPIFDEPMRQGWFSRRFR
jgi:hypothetical protein